MIPDKTLAEKAALLRQYGWAERYSSHFPGWNTRLDEIQAAVLRVKLKHLDADNAKRAALAKLYDNELANNGEILPQIRDGSTHVYHLYVIRSAKRDELLAHLKEKGIGAAIHYPIAIHQQPAYEKLPGHDDLPVTEQICKEIISLPIYPELAQSDAMIITEAIRAFAIKQGSNDKENMGCV